MFALIVIAHPSPGSLSHAMADLAAKVLASHGSELAVHDLCAEQFNPVQPTGESGNTASSDPLVEQHCAELARADLILVFHPNWWGQPPAILKGWIDRVFRLNTAYAYPAGMGFEGVPVGLLRARQALVFNTSNTPAERESLVFGDPLDALWKKCVFGLCGVADVVRRTYAPVAASTAEQRAAWLEEVAALVADAAGAIPISAHREPVKEGSPPCNVGQRLAALGLQLPEVTKPRGNFKPWVMAGSMLYISGKGAPLRQGPGPIPKVGAEVSVEQARLHAREVGLYLLALIQQALGDFSRLRRVVKVFGMVNATPDFVNHTEVINGCSDLLVEVLGDRGEHARSAIGVGSLPMGFAVEIEAVVEFE
jgi:NAD(P)H dehydrogenase (quinone)